VGVDRLQGRRGAGAAARDHEVPDAEEVVQRQKGEHVRKTKDVYHKRQFLNEKKGPAMVEATLTNCSWDDPDPKVGKRFLDLEGSVKLTDCSRSVELDFSANNQEQAYAAVYKLERLIAVLDGFAGAIRDEARKEAARKWKAPKADK
jgi:hypothetical protein